MLTHRVAALAACAGLLTAALPSHALDSRTLFCSGVPITLPSTTVANAGYVNCLGPTAGSVSGAAAEASVTAWARDTLGASFPTGQSFAWAGKSDDAGSGPFTSSPTGTSGVLTFDTAQKGLFVLALQGGPQSNYNYYLFNGGSGAGVPSLNFDTNGLYISFVNGVYSVGPNLAVAGLYTLVPEPASMALMLAGLAGIGWARRRRG